MTVKHIRRNYSEQAPSVRPSGKISEPSGPLGPVKEMPSRSAAQMASQSSGQSDGNKKTWIAPIIFVLILILILIFFMRKGKSGTTAYFY